MRRTGFSGRGRLAASCVAAICLVSIPLFAQAPQQSKGVPPRSSASDYTAHVASGGVTYAATLLSPEQVKHTFAYDISKAYVVFEVAIYPAGGGAEIDPDGFIVRSAPTSDAARRADSATVASVIQQKNLPKQPSRIGPVVASTTVGYESGTDPYTGRRVHGTYTESQVGVGAGGDRGPSFPSPGGYPQDRELLEDQLWEKSLPAGRVQRPVAGYLYFPSSLLKKKSGAGYQIEYVAGEPQLEGTPAPSPARIQLQVPAKSR